MRHSKLPKQSSHVQFPYTKPLTLGRQGEPAQLSLIQLRKAAGFPNAQSLAAELGYGKAQIHSLECGRGLLRKWYRKYLRMMILLKQLGESTE